MYYCLICQSTHHLNETTAAKLFRTGFRTFPSGEKFPLGVCVKHKEEKVPNKKVS
jgi:hypothetical protein